MRLSLGRAWSMDRGRGREGGYTFHRPIAVIWDRGPEPAAGLFRCDAPRLPQRRDKFRSVSDHLIIEISPLRLLHEVERYEWSGPSVEFFSRS